MPVHDEGQPRGDVPTIRQHGLVQNLLPRQRGKVTRNNPAVLNAILQVAEQGCKWRGLPECFGHWHRLYTRMNRWTKAGVLGGCLPHRQIIRVRVEAVPLDNTTVKVHPDGTTGLHLVAATARTAVGFSLSAGPMGDAPAGRKWLTSIPLSAECVVMDQAYEGDETCQTVRDRVWACGAAQQQSY